MKATRKDSDSIVGDECHIVARRPHGPRGNASPPLNKLDGYDNLILLCKVHHKMVDDQPSTYTVELLRKIKKNHEDWVKKTLQQASNDKKKRKNQIAPRITTGKEALAIVTGAHLFDFDYDEPSIINELDLISNFLQTLKDWGDIGQELEQSERVRTGYNLSKDISQLDNYGFAVFGILQTRRYKVGGDMGDWLVAYIRVLRKDNPDILHFDEQSIHTEDLATYVKGCAEKLDI